MNRKLDNLGRIVIPAEMRKQLGINEGELINIECIGNKIIITNPEKSNYKEKLDKLKDELIKDRMEQFDDYVIYLQNKYLEMLGE